MIIWAGYNLGLESGAWCSSFWASYDLWAGLDIVSSWSWPNTYCICCFKKKRTAFVAELCSRDRSSTARWKCLAKIWTIIVADSTCQFGQTLHRYEPKRSQVLIRARCFKGVPRNVLEAWSQIWRIGESVVGGHGWWVRIWFHSSGFPWVKAAGLLPERVNGACSRLWRKRVWFTGEAEVDTSFAYHVVTLVTHQQCISMDDTPPTMNVGPPRRLPRLLHCMQPATHGCLLPRFFLKYVSVFIG
jgi:hypothetical protein